MIVHDEAEMQFGYYTTAARDGPDERGVQGLVSILRFRWGLALGRRDTGQVRLTQR